MDHERIRALVDKIKQRKLQYNNMEEYGTEPIPEQPDDDNEIEEDSADEIETENESESTVSDNNGLDNQILIDALLSRAPRMDLTGKGASIAMTLLYLLRMNPADFESQKDIAHNLGLAYSTVERHIKYLRDNNFIETEIVTDALGSKMIYSFDGLRETLRSLGAKV